MPPDKISANIAAAVLSGGRNRRMAGRNKAFAEIGGVAVIRNTVKLLKEIFPEIFIVTNSPEEYLSYNKDCRIIRDEIKDIGPLGGIHAALTKTTKEAVFFAACDMPFLHNDYIRKELNYFYGIDCEALVPRVGTSIEPLHAIYKKDLRYKIEDFISAGRDCSIRGFLETINVAYWDLKENPLNRSIFKNLNTEEDLKGVGGNIYAGKIKGLV